MSGVRNQKESAEGVQQEDNRVDINTAYKMYDYPMIMPLRGRNASVLHSRNSSFIIIVPLFDFGSHPKKDRS